MGALEALADRRTQFRSAISAAHDQMAGYLAAHRARTHGHAQVVARELGQFAAGRIDAERFGALFAESHFLTPENAERIERLVGVLAELLAEGNELFTCDVPAGGNLHSDVERAIAHAGRVFGAVTAFQAIKTGTYRAERHDDDVRGFPFSKWNRSERLLGLPLVVEVDGADAHAEGLADYIDGRMAIVLVIRGSSTPAPLVRLVSPGTFVVQTNDVSGLGVLATCEAPVVAALVPANATRFIHDPSAARSMQARLRVTYVPADAPRQPLGARSVWQQLEELTQLRTLEQLGRPEAMLAVPPGLPTSGPVANPTA
ncbi:MAG TPA: hypothetical protein VL326_16565, partial [Kofleriaceae bacterium]|nr:hypothetical protein [Kofleriaceae bacterium]